MDGCLIMGIDKKAINKNFVCYDFEVFSNIWLVVFRHGDRYKFIINDQEELRNYYLTISDKILYGYNNYGYDDKILGRLLFSNNVTNKQLYDMSSNIVNHVPNSPSYYNFASKLFGRTLDVMQEISSNATGLKKIEYGLGWGIEETPIDFTKPLPEHRINEVLHYCKHDVDSTTETFKQRIAYFSGKWDLITRFKLSPNPMNMMRFTRATLSSIVLDADKDKYIRVTRDDFHYVKSDIINQNILDYYHNCVNLINEETGVVANGLPQDIDWCGLPTSLSTGGIHGCLDESQVYSDEDYIIMDIDVKSFYPNIIMNNNWYSRKSRNPSLLREIYNMKTEAKANGDKSLGNVVKIVLNAYYGSLGGQFTALYDPVYRLNICLEGQVRLLELSKLLYDNINKPEMDKQQFILINLNTDGIMFKILRSELDNMRKIVEDFSKQWLYEFDEEYFDVFVQRDVNNYFFKDPDGNISGKGIYAACLQDDGQVIDFRTNASIKSTVLPSAVLKGAINYVAKVELPITTLDYFVLCSGTKVSTNYLLSNITPKLNKKGQSLQINDTTFARKLTFNGEYWVDQFGNKAPTLKNKYDGHMTALQKINRYYASNQSNQKMIVNKDGVKKKNTPDNINIYNDQVKQIPSDLDHSWYEQETDNLIQIIENYKKI